MRLTLLYRGPLASCNYGCGYCPFSKKEDDTADLETDRLALERLCNWLEQQRKHRISLFFTPWGEALIRPWYRQAIIRLSKTESIEKIVVQTNLSAPIKWVEECRTEPLRLWATYHPEQCRRDRFVATCKELLARGVRMSVGAVGIDQHRAEIEALRRELPPDLYLWINAYNDDPGQYDEEAIRWYAQIDPLFPVTIRNHASLGHYCRAGYRVLSVSGDGTLRRCHFIDETIGNLYAPDFERNLRQSTCTNSHCDCYIGYVHLPHLGLDKLYGNGLIERIPRIIDTIRHA
jgi:MoaA/NifB/PqqE/SkfB family radical SAM enzyme